MHIFSLNAQFIHRNCRRLHGPVGPAQFGHQLHTLLLDEPSIPQHLHVAVPAEMHGPMAAARPDGRRDERRPNRLRPGGRRRRRDRRPPQRWTNHAGDPSLAMAKASQRAPTPRPVLALCTVHVERPLPQSAVLVGAPI